MTATLETTSPSEAAKLAKLEAHAAKLATERAELADAVALRNEQWRDLCTVAEDKLFRVGKVRGFITAAHAQTEHLRAALFSVAFGNGDPHESSRIAGEIAKAVGSIPELETVAVEAERLAKIECEKAREFADANNVPAAARPDWLA